MKIKINLDRIIAHLIAGIKRRTRGGKDIYLQSFIPYSPAYAKKKNKTIVNLYDTGAMQNSIQQVSPDQIGFNNRYEQTKSD